MKTWWRRRADLDDYQKNAIQLPLDGNFLISGPPGSGKTNILVLRAQYVSSSGLANVNLIVYARVLREFIATGCGDHINFPADQVLTFASWANRLIKERGIAMPDDIHDLSEPDARVRRLELLEEATAGVRQDLFDSLIVDEVQDLTRDEIDILSRLTPRLFMAGDLRQRIYEAGQGMKTARERIQLGRDELVLPFHYRIGPAICEAADRIKVDSGRPLAETENYQDSQFPSRVDPHLCDSFEAQCMEMAETITTQLRTYAGDWIGVIVNRNDEGDRVFQILQETDIGDKVKLFKRRGGDLSFDPERPVCIMTLQAAKGTEFRAVHWIGAGNIPYYKREKAFTLITRAKTSLDVYHTRALTPGLQSALTKRRAPNIGLPE